jgi:hypothetical protein
VPLDIIVQDWRTSVLQWWKGIQSHVAGLCSDEELGPTAEAKVLLFGATVANSFQIHMSTFLTDNFLLAKAATIQRPASDHLKWDIKGIMADFFQKSSEMELTIYHIFRDINGVSHNGAHQVLRQSLKQHVFTCVNQNHGHNSCPVVSILQNFLFQGYVIHSVLCT